MEHMYLENRKSINAFVGCRHNCVYCKPSFQRQAKRFEGKGYDFQPRYHPERLLKSPPRTEEEQFIFFPSMGDLAFATPITVQAHIEYARKYADRTFLVQSKNPQFFKDFAFPNNVLLGTTIETNLLLFNTPSKYRYYSEISKAPYPCHRRNAMIELCHNDKTVTIEPILDFIEAIMVQWMKEIKPKIIWVGYDNHNCHLPEPTLERTVMLIARLIVEGFDVRLKKVRKAWYEL